jgi:uncharacterized protein YbjT (DUF2867 family)
MTEPIQEPVKVLVLGANGQLARNTTRAFLERSDVSLTLYLRRASRLPNPDPARVTIVEGDVLDAETLQKVIKGQDVVYANLAGDMKRQAQSIDAAMQAANRHCEIEVGLPYIIYHVDIIEV